MRPKNHNQVFLLSGIVMLSATISCAKAAHGQCLTRVCQQRVVTTQPLLLPVQYKVGLHLQQQAVDTYQFRSSEEYQEYQYLKGFYQGVQSLKATQPVAQENQAPAQAYSAQIPTIVKHCASCHSGKKPKGGIWLDGSVDLLSPEAAGKRDQIMRAITNGKMPKDKGPLDDASFGSIIGELYAESKGE